MGGNGAPLASLRMRLPGDPLGGEGKKCVGFRRARAAGASGWEPGKGRGGTPGGVFRLPGAKVTVNAVCMRRGAIW